MTDRDQEYFKQVREELENDDLRWWLWFKASWKAKGDQMLTVALYFTDRIQQLKAADKCK